MATVTMAQRLDTFMEDIETVVPQLPEYLITRFKEYHLLQEELDILEQTLHTKGGYTVLRIGRSMSRAQVQIHKNRIAELRAQLKGLLRVAEVIRLGYEPYTVPDKWYAGYTGKVKRDWELGGEQLSREFVAPMPAFVIDKWEAAKKTRQFDEFIVASPVESHFKQVSSLFIDPVLIGYVATGQGRIHFSSFSRGLTVHGGTGFLITMWDLENDRKAAGLDF